MRLSDSEAQQFAQFAQAAVKVVDEAGFAQLVTDHVQPLLPHGMLLAVIGQRRFDHLSILQRVGVGYPDALLRQFPEAINIRERPVIKRWLRTREPAVIDLDADRGQLSEREIREIEEMDLGRLAVHGVPDLSTGMASYFSFAQVRHEIDREQVATLLALLCPLLHVSLCRLRTQADGAVHPVQALTPVERELLTWLAAGRTNQEMAQLRSRSPATIRNQLEKLYAKLGVRSRAEAVAVLLTEGGLTSMTDTAA